MVKVKYVGQKPAAIDTIAGTGKVWNGNGDVHDVTERQARALIAYPERWALVDGKDLAKVDKEHVTRFILDGTRVEVAESDLKKQIEKMSKEELMAYALERFQKSFNPKMGRTAMIDTIEELARGMDPFVAI